MGSCDDHLEFNEHQSNLKCNSLDCCVGSLDNKIIIDCTEAHEQLKMHLHFKCKTCR